MVLALEPVDLLRCCMSWCRRLQRALVTAGSRAANQPTAAPPPRGSMRQRQAHRRLPCQLQVHRRVPCLHAAPPSPSGPCCKALSAAAVLCSGAPPRGLQRLQETCSPGRVARFWHAVLLRLLVLVVLTVRSSPLGLRVRAQPQARVASLMGTILPLLLCRESRHLATLMDQIRAWSALQRQGQPLLMLLSLPMAFATSLRHVRLCWPPRWSRRRDLDSQLEKRWRRGRSWPSLESAHRLLHLRS